MSRAVPGHSPELSAALETLQIPDCQADEVALAAQFDQPDKARKWREGVLKSSFNYLLLDPRYGHPAATPGLKLPFPTLSLALGRLQPPSDPASLPHPGMGLGVYPKS